MPLVRPVMVQVVVVTVQVCPPLEVTVYPVMVEPPSIEGAVQEMVDEPSSPSVAVTLVTANGRVLAITISGSSVISTSA